MEVKGTEAIETELVAAEDIAVAVKKILADHKVDLSDLVHVAELAKHSDHLVAAAKAIKEVVAEAKDLSIAEVMALIASGTAHVHAVEKA